MMIFQVIGNQKKVGITTLTQRPVSQGLKALGPSDFEALSGSEATACFQETSVQGPLSLVLAI